MAFEAVAGSQTSEMPPSHLPTSSRGPAKSMSIASDSPAAKSLSLNINSPALTTNRPRPASLISTSPDRQPQPLEPLSEESSDPNAFLTALAAQERRVLELKEELGKAEADLVKLKKQWAVHEATKKKQEMRHFEPLRPLVSPNRDVVVEMPEQMRRTGKDEERKRAIYVRTRQPQRKVFEGGRHTRTLSLLTPTSLANGNARSDKKSLVLDSYDKSKGRSVPTTAVPRSSAGGFPTSTHGTKDDLVNTGKQFVGDIREGLWTFIEDLRQATVGDEAISEARSRHIQESAGRLQVRGKPISAAPRNGSSPASCKVRTPDELQRNDSKTDARDQEQSPAVAVIARNANTTIPPLESPPLLEDDEDDGWDNWDSPPPKSSISASFSTTAGSSPRTSLR